MEVSSNEAAIRLLSFVSVFAILALWEILAPRRQLKVGKTWRWTSNLGLVILNTFVVRVVLPMGAVGIADIASASEWGLFNNVALSSWFEVILAVIILDLAIYLQHVMFHAVPNLWRLHMVHHADLDLDVSTGLRFHTIEIALSMSIKAGAIILLGAPVLAVLLFEVFLNATSMFNHANARLPHWLDRKLRLVVVTPDMHRVHHSVVTRETNSNFGFNLPWWDFLFGTYRDQPAAGHEGMIIGLMQFRSERQVDRLPGMLALPFVGDPGNYPVNREGDGDKEPRNDTLDHQASAPALAGRQPAEPDRWHDRCRPGSRW
jgi:sterol desaturase/sphingolipid hydroxylase (fatty acid hydroxylase superfamily)